MANISRRQRLRSDFQERLASFTSTLNSAVATDDGDWIIKGFIDIAKNIYTISVDTKVISKIMEILLFPEFSRFSDKFDYKMVLCREQNFYPDITFIDSNKNKYALDLKSTYRKNETKVNGMTLGAFTGYFRDRKSKKNVTYPYDEYIGHFVLGLIYTRTDKNIDERKRHKIDELENITSVIRDFRFFVQEKYKIAVDRPGSGNTKNIGSVCTIKELIAGQGPFSKLGEEIFDDYWMYYLTKDMARAIDLKRAPYKNLREYFDFKSIKKDI